MRLDWPFLRMELGLLWVMLHQVIRFPNLYILILPGIYSIAGIGTNVYNSSVIAAGFQRPAEVGGDTMWYHGPAVCAVGAERTYVTAMSITPFAMIGFKAVRDASTLE